MGVYKLAQNILLGTLKYLKHDVTISLSSPDIFIIIIISIDKKYRFKSTFLHIAIVFRANSSKCSKLFLYINPINSVTSQSTK